MCIILACKPHRRPTADVLRTCWAHNPDGGGIMWAERGHVEISKGLMTRGDLERAIAQVPEDAPLIIHMRIGTSGGFGPEVTHPYPVTDGLEALHALDVECAVGIAHNGVLPYPTDTARGVSDTVYYVSHVVAPLAHKRTTRRAGGLLRSHKALRRLKVTSRGSRLALLDGSGDVRLIGDGWQGVCPGIQASNSSWREYRTAAYGSRWLYGWDDDDEGDGAGSWLIDDEAAAWDEYTDRWRVMDAWGCGICDAYHDCMAAGPCCIPDDFGDEVLAHS